MDVDDPIRKRLGHERTEDLHVAGEDHEIDLLFVQHRDLGALLRFLRRGGDREIAEGNPETLRDRLEILTIADDEGNLHGEFAALVAREEIVEAVIILRHEKRGPRHDVGEVQRPTHREALHDRSEGGGDTFAGDRETFQLPFHPHEEGTFLEIDMLIDVNDVTLIFVEKGREGGDDASPVGTGDQEDRRGRICQGGAQGRRD